MLITHVGHLVTNDPSLGPTPLGIVEDAAIVVEHGRVAWVGPAAQAPEQVGGPVIDAEGRAAIPGFVDAHTQPVFAGTWDEAYAERAAGRTSRAQLLRDVVAATRRADDAALVERAGALVAEALAQGTTTIAAASGFGLTVADEVRSLRAAGRHTDEVTFLGAHAVPTEHGGDPDAYVDRVVAEMIPACHARAKWIDVVCDSDGFDESQTRRLLAAGIAAGLRPRVQANRLQHGPGLQLAAELDAAAVAHAVFASDADIAALAASQTVVTLLPAALAPTEPRPDARRLLDAGATVALATGCSPVDGLTTSMPFVLALAVRTLQLTPDEALWAATRGGARALRRGDVGHLAVGARADVVLLDAPSHLHLASRPGVPLIHRVIQRGRPVQPTTKGIRP